MNPNLYFCPNCNKNFLYKTNYSIIKNKIQLDKIYQYQIINLFCNNCKKSINGINLDGVVLWNQDYQFYYNKFVSNKNIGITTDKRYLYLFFPYNDQETVKSLFKFIKKDNFDALVIPQYYKEYIQWDKQLCLLPSSIFQCNQKKIYPNYLAQKIIINQSNKMLNSKLYSVYNTFFYNFNILYNLKDWKKLKLKITN